MARQRKAKELLSPKLCNDCEYYQPDTESMGWCRMMGEWTSKLTFCQFFKKSRTKKEKINGHKHDNV